jgi:hypothetical protein
MLREICAKFAQLLRNKFNAIKHHSTRLNISRSRFEGYSPAATHPETVGAGTTVNWSAVLEWAGAGAAGSVQVNAVKGPSGFRNPCRKTNQSQRRLFYFPGRFRQKFIG